MPHHTTSYYVLALGVDTETHTYTHFINKINFKKPGVYWRVRHAPGLTKMTNSFILY